MMPVAHVPPTHASGAGHPPTPPDTVIDPAAEPPTGATTAPPLPPVPAPAPPPALDGAPAPPESEDLPAQPCPSASTLATAARLQPRQRMRSKLARAHTGMLRAPKIAVPTR